MNDKINKALSDLEFDRYWYDFGICSEELLLKLHEEFLNSDDKNTEHYRHGTFVQYFRNRTEMSDEEIEQFIHTNRIADNGVLMDNALHLLATFHGLTINQIEFLKQHPE